MASLGEKIKHLRATRRPSLTQAELAKEVGISRDQIANYETDRTEPPVAVVRKLARLWQVPETWLWDDRASLHPPVGNVVVTKRKESPLVNLIPFWGEAPAGSWARPMGDVELVQVSSSVDVEGCVCVRVSGNSLWPRLVDGQLAIVKLSKVPKEGVITLAANESGDLTLKVLRYISGEWQLHSINPEYGNLSAERWELLGHVIHIEETNPAGIRP